MKCPQCQAKLLPVAGELFCLQCGELVLATGDQPVGDMLKIEETSDPLLRRAITDSVESNVVFNVPEGTKSKAKDELKLAEAQSFLGAGAAQPVSTQTPAKPKASFASLRSMMAWHHHSMMVPQVGAAATDTLQQVATTGALYTSGQTMAVAAAAAPANVGSKAFAITSPMVLALGALSLLVVVNVLAGWYYAGRVYPGVKVGSLAVGGWTFAQLHEKLAAGLPQPKLTAIVNGRAYSLDISGVGAVSTATVEHDARQMGRSVAVPLMGLSSALLSRPLTPSLGLSDDAVAKSVQQLAVRIDRAPSNAAAMVVGTEVLLLADKPGVKLDTAATAAAIRAAYGHANTVSISTIRTQPAVPASAFAGEVASAQAIIGTSVQITLRKTKYAPTAAQIAEWVTIPGPGQGVIISQSGVANFVQSIPGTFDRSGTVSSLLAALNAHHDTILAPSLKQVTVLPKVVSISASSPIMNYSYCVDASMTTLPGSSAAIQTALGSGGSWTLGGRIHFTLVGSECNLSLQAVTTSALDELNPVCSQQNSCRIHNDLAINPLFWDSLPALYPGIKSAYQVELISHVVGQWLGFDHPVCNQLALSTPTLSSSSVTLPGCSPKWYAVPPELQDTKVLAGL